MTNVLRGNRAGGSQAGQPGIPASAFGLRTNDFFGLLPRAFVQRRKEFFTYNIRFNTLAAGATATQTVSIQNDSDFVWVQGAMTVTSSNFTTFTSSANLPFQPAPFLATISDSAAGVLLQDSATHINNLFSDIRLPFTLPYPKIFRKGGQLSVQLQNQDSGSAYVVNLSFHGFKVYFMPEEQQ